MLIDSTQLVGGKEVGRRCGVSHAAVVNWTNRFTDFPEPVYDADGMRLWLWPSVKAWAIAHGRLPATGTDS